jgi:hypothetical protein
MINRNLPLAAILLSLPLAAQAGSSTPVAEVLSTKQSVPPSILFLVDLSADMDKDCFASGNTCLVDTIDAIRQVALHFPDAQYGVVGTVAGASDNTYLPIAPIGSTYAEISTALSTVTTNGSTTRNLSEALEALGTDYYSQGTPDDGVDNDGDGFTGDWGESPIAYDCSTTHVIALSTGRPVADDEGPDTNYAASPADNDVRCDEFGVIGGSSINADIECHLDNVVHRMFYNDYQAGLTDVQRVVVSVVGLGLDLTDAEDSTADELFANAGENTEAQGMYSNATSKSEAISDILAVAADIMSGVYSRSTPVISSNGAWLTYSYYEVMGDNPLAEGHFLGYQIDNDPNSSAYGSLIYEGSDYYGAAWDGGWLLYSRVADGSEVNDDDQDGYSRRDIYFFDSAFKTTMAGDYAERRMGFDSDFVDAVTSTNLTSILSATTTAVDLDGDGSTDCSAPDNMAYDLNRDGCQSKDDLQTLVDFTRGVSETQFRYLDTERGQWKLADSPYSIPAIVTKTNNVYSNSMSYRRFLQLLGEESMPDIALLAANDGMLHAFALEDDGETLTHDEAGEELWAWIPSGLIWRDRGPEWASGLVDSMWYGRTYLFDGSPVVEDVWLDLDGDREKDCSETDDLDTCEWRRVVVTQQGLGGTRTIALDITYTDAPTFLWEVTNTDDSTAMGMTTGRPVIFNVYDRSVPTAVTDRWVAMWTSGRPATYESSSTDYFKSVEGSLYTWGMGDDAFASEGMAEVSYSPSGDNIELLEHPDTLHAALLDSDLDSKLEYTYISAPPTVVDSDGDGDADVAYFPVSVAYDPDEVLGPLGTGAGGSTWIYKAIFNEDSPSDLTWCEFYDPEDGAPSSTGGSTVAFGSRPEVYYSITAAWLGSSGQLGVYWGTGTPYTANDTSEAGAMFFMVDNDPEDCASTAESLTCGTEDGGFYAFRAGERLTSDPIVFAKVLYFATYTPDADACEVGTGRLYGLDYQDCGQGLDTNADGTIDTNDDDNIEAEGYLSNVAIGDNGKIYYSSATDVDIQIIDAVQDPFKGTATVGWMEMY